MPLSPDQRSVLEAEAKKRGVDPAKLIAEAERQSSSSAKEGRDEDRKPAPKSDKPAAAEATKPLYAYHLPFVTVNEVREAWLGLSSIAGGEENAAKYAARMMASASEPAKPDDA